MTRAKSEPEFPIDTASAAEPSIFENPNAKFPAETVLLLVRLPLFIDAVATRCCSG